MTGRLRHFLIPTALLLLVIAGLAPLYWPSPERNVEKRVRQGARAVEMQDLDTLAGLISQNYRGDVMESRAALLEKGAEAFKQLEEALVKIEELEITVEDTTAQVRVEFLFSGSYTGSSVYRSVPFYGVIPGRKAKNDQAELLLEKEADGQWRVTEFRVLTATIP